MPTTIRDLIQHLYSNDEEIRLLDYFQVWMEVTGLEFKDVLHLKPSSLQEGTARIAKRLGNSLDLFDNDQLQEAACRCLENIVVIGEPIVDNGVSVEKKDILSWDGNAWVCVIDPKMRIRENYPTFKQALAAVRKN
jgi:hypothetical protein